ncbi:lysophospholipid acyltransferase family protein [Affinirhizobium pseudoryzae]|jgi:KDO2-lipid IV(A) lauroyltransferase|uniref:lysophospholipid acyltransferase family protein n=1 Tax=Allorhizobium pseudoryzae TaxID=379684 RepID=UPI0013EBDA37|nr:lipid A biosynthesis lauroyl acyltransferase [Allorhizobium pseudoryzae]
MTKADPPPVLPKRKAWRFVSPSAPRLSALLGDAPERKAFLRYWLTDNIWNGLHLSTFYALRLMPMDLVSRFGAALGRFAIPRFHKVAAGRARDTMEALRPARDAAEREARFDAYCAAQGRLMTEFAVVTRIARHPDRLIVNNVERVVDAAKRGPLIMVGMHLGNWEIGPIVMRRIGLQPYAMYVPPAGRAKAWIAERVRQKAGLRFIPPGMQGVRPALSILKSGGVVSIFCDEAFGGRIRGPFFGRPPHLEGNLALAVRLARMTGATLCPWYTRRGEDFRFTLQFLDPVCLPKEPPGPDDLMRDVTRLSAVLEPVIAENAVQWFFVDSMLQ